MVVQHNMRALNANNNLKISTNAQAKSAEKLSSGYRINRAGDDAAGLSISEKLRSQIRGLTQATANAQNGISLAQTAEGALAEVETILQRMNELAVQAKDGTMTADDKASIQDEIDALVTEIDRTSTATTFNDKKLLDGSLNVDILVGTTNDAANNINITVGDMSATALLSKKSDGETDSGAFTAATKKFDITHADALDTIKGAIKSVSAQRSSLGATQNRLEHTVNNLTTINENTTAAESQIRDTDVATEMVKYSNNNILMQAGQAMLAQSNQANSGILALLQ